MPDGTCDLDDPGKSGQSAGNGEGQHDQLLGIEAAKACGARCGSHDADFKTLDHSAEHDGRSEDDDQCENRPQVQTAAFDENGNGGDGIEFRGGRKVEAV